MKTIVSLMATLLLAATSHANAGIIAGPITNPVNGHDYYLLEPGNWMAAEAVAESLGGTLAVIRNAAEQEWVFSKFGSGGGVKRDLWIGLHRKVPGGPFFWPNAEPVDYINWYPGEPNNVGGVENCAHMRGGDDRPGTWNDLAGPSLLCGVVEVPGETNPELTGKRRQMLIGDWYEGGKADRPCWIASTGRLLFAINNRAGNNVSRVVFLPGKKIFSPGVNVYGEVVGGRILWSNGTWWSRKPIQYGPVERKEAMDQ